MILLVNPEIRFWGGLVALFVGGLAYLAFRFTKGLTGGYLKEEVSEGLKVTLLFIHGLGSLILALVIPNNFLVDIEFIGGLYKESGLWIAFSILILLFIFLITIGTLLTLLSGQGIKKVK